MSDDAPGDVDGAPAREDGAPTRELEARNEALTRELAAARAELDEVLRIAGHDLRAPIRGVLHLIDWLGEDLRGGDANEAQAHLALLSGRARRLSRMIDGLLDYSRAGRGSGEPVTTRACLMRVAEAQAAELADEPGLSPLVLVAGPGAELELRDGESLALVLHRLLDNAARHAGGGDAPVTVTISATAPEPGRVEVAVADDGVGIEPRHHDRIWGLFQTLSARDRVDTTGVGLAVVKRLVERRVGGRVSIASEPGQGTTLRFDWPA